MTEAASLYHYSFHVGQRLRALREAHGLSIRAAADAAGLSKTRLVQIEASELPNAELKTLLRLQLAYKASSLEDLLGPLPSATLAGEVVAHG